MWELGYKQSWALKNWCFWTVMLEKTLESPLDCRRSNQSILRKSVLCVHWKDWCWSWNSNTLATKWEELTHFKRPWWWERLKAGGEGMTGDEMVGWHHRLSGRVSVNSRSWWWQGSLVCCGSWDRKESDTTEQLNWPEPSTAPSLPSFKWLKPWYRKRKYFLHFQELCKP